MPEEISEVRLDKWLWSVRLFKTRRLAADACAAGKVKIENKACKASKLLRQGDVMEIQMRIIKKKIKVIRLLNKRVSASKVEQYMKDLTPDEEYQHLNAIQKSSFYRPKGLGRPTKKERRLLEQAKNKSGN